jgi:hypothetical protein
MRPLIASILLLAVMVPGCGQIHAAVVQATATQRQSGDPSGIQGTTTVDAGCPHVIGTPCPRRPFHARLLIRLSGSSGPAVRAESGADGRFRVPLAPGRYTVQPVNIDGAPVPNAFPVSVTVRPGTWVTLPIDFDSGIR